MLLTLASKETTSGSPPSINLIPTLVATDRNKMVRLKYVQGRIYRFKSESECLGLRILTPVIQHLVRCHMVLVLDVVRQERLRENNDNKCVKLYSRQSSTNFIR
jgi:hypothetical protein